MRRLWSDLTPTGRIALLSLAALNVLLPAFGGLPAAGVCLGVDLALGLYLLAGPED